MNGGAPRPCRRRSLPGRRQGAPEAEGKETTRQHGGGFGKGGGAELLRIPPDKGNRNPVPGKYSLAYSEENMIYYI